MLAPKASLKPPLTGSDREPKRVKNWIETRMEIQSEEKGPGPKNFSRDPSSARIQNDFSSNNIAIVHRILPPSVTQVPSTERNRSVNFVTIEQGQHLELQKSDQLPYRLIDILGTGASAVVELVEDTTSSCLYARKTFRNV